MDKLSGKFAVSAANVVKEGAEEPSAIRKVPAPAGPVSSV
jgi:hypothetical protein